MSLQKRPNETEEEYQKRKYRVDAVRRSSTFNLVRGGGAYLIATPTFSFSTVLYTGTGADLTVEVPSITTGVDFVWAKIRTTTNNHEIHDSLRGPLNRLLSNLTNAEDAGGGVTSFGTSSFSLRLSSINIAGENAVAWCASLPTDNPTNTDGTITTSTKTNGWMSAISYIGTGANATVGHSLAVTPELVIFKSRGDTNPWGIYNKDVGFNNLLLLNTSAASTAGTLISAADATTMSLVVGTYANGSGVNYIAYAFTSIAGKCKVGSFTNQSTITGVGFEPSFVMAKRSDALGDWIMVDNQRPNFLEANTTDTEATNGLNPITFTADGFTTTLSTGTYIYMAIA